MESIIEMSCKSVCMKRGSTKVDGFKRHDWLNSEVMCIAEPVDTVVSEWSKRLQACANFAQRKILQTSVVGI